MKKRIMLTLTALSVLTSSVMTFQPVYRRNGYITAFAEDASEPVIRKSKTEYGTIYYSLENGEITITGYYINDGEFSVITIPSEIDGSPVTEFNGHIGYQKGTAVEGFVFPESIRKINAEAISAYCKWVWVDNPDIEITDMDYTSNDMHMIYGHKNTSLEHYAIKENMIFKDCETAVHDGELIYTLKDGELSVSSCSKYAKEVTIPAEINGIPVTSIGDSAFYACQKLEKISIPDSVTSIGAYALSSCGNLKSLYIPDSVKEIGSNAFSHCTNINDVRLPEGITRIPSRCFYSSKSLMEINIPDTVTVIGSSAFYDCTYIEKIELPDSITDIEDYAFHNCRCLEKINIPDNVKTIGEYAFYKCEKLAEISIPESVTYIGTAAFNETLWAKNSTTTDGLVIINGCLTDAKNYTGEILEIPENVHTISKQAFAGQYDQNTTLKEVIIPDGVTELSNECFLNCTGLESVKLPDSIKTIGDGCFKKCTSLKEINIPKRIEEIGNEAFSYCEKLEAVNLPDSIKTISDGCFKNCITLKEIVFPEKLEKICSNVFQSCSSLEEVKMPETVTEIGKSAFSACTGLKEISVPSDITEISYQCFAGCSALEKINLPEQLKSIDSMAFTGCTALKGISLPNTLEIISYMAFANCSSLESIDIPENAEIGESAFNYCTSLGEVKMSEKQESDLSNQEFKNTPWLDSLREENPLIIIHNKVIDGKLCKGDIVIPDGVTEICPFAFEDSEITSVKLPDTIKTIGKSAFHSCKKLEEFTIPDGIEIITSSMFSACENLKTVNIPDSVKTIEYGAFEWCYSLTEFTVPETVSSVGMAFEYADNLKTITFLNPECSIAGDSENFLSMPLNTTVRGYADSTAYWYAFSTKRNFEYISITGDANCDNKLDISDAVLIMQSISNPAKYSLTEQGKKNADIAGNNDGITNADALAIQKELLKLD